MSASVDKLMGFQQIQADFCGWIRQPQADAPASLHDIPLARLHTYHELLSNNMNQFVDMVFPVAQSKVHGDTWQHWRTLFFQQVRCQSPLYIDIPEQFLTFMQDQPALWDAEMPWLIELLQYEWMALHVELAEYIAPDVSQCLDEATAKQLEQYQSLKFGMPVWVLAYQWPVHTWQVDQNDNLVELQPTCLLVWRDIEDVIQQHVLTPLMAVLVEHLASLSAFSLAELQAFLASQPFAAQWSAEQQQGICLQVMQQLVGWRLLYKK